MALAVLGYDQIHIAQRAVAYLMIAVLTVFSVGALVAMQVPGRASGTGASSAPCPSSPQLFAAAAYQLSWSIYVSDYSRYLPREVSVRASFWWTYLGAFIGGAWMMLVGTIVQPRPRRTLNVAAAIEQRRGPGVPRVRAACC